MENRFNPEQMGVPASETPEEQPVAERPEYEESSASGDKERLIESIDSRVDVIIDLRETIDDLTEKEVFGGEVIKVLDEYVEQAIKDMPGAKERYDRLAEISRKTRDIMDELDSLGRRSNYLNMKMEATGDESVVEELEEVQQSIAAKREEGKLIRKEKAALESSPDKEFLDTLASVVEGLKVKAGYVEKVSKEVSDGDFNRLLKDIEERFAKISRDDIADVEFTPFSVDILMNDKALNELYASHPKAVVSKIDGFHLNNTPISFIGLGEGQKKTEDSIRWVMLHERMHNYVDPLFVSENPWSEIESISTRGTKKDFVVELTVEDDGTVRIEDESGIRIKPPKEEIMSQMKNELMAQLEFLEMLWENELRYGIVESEKESTEEVVSRVVRTYATAGDLVQKYCDALDTIVADGERSDGERKAAEQVKNEYMRDIVRMDRGLRNGFARAADLGQDARKAAHAFASAMDPSQYRHLEWYLKERYEGEDNAE
jgi:hypothetical protein